jgi:hypothetical protein
MIGFCIITKLLIVKHPLSRSIWQIIGQKYTAELEHCPFADLDSNEFWPFPELESPL